MAMASSIPLVVVVAGPNGAGKSTTAPALLQDALRVDEFVNADAIAGGLSVLRPQSAAVAAGRVMLRRITQLSEDRSDFAFETTLASRSFAPRLKRLRGVGYRVHIAFLALPSPDLAVARVAERVRLGGHDVPEHVIRRRFVGGLRNLLTLYDGVADSWDVHDNAHAGSPRLIACRQASDPIDVLDAVMWNVLLEYLV